MFRILIADDERFIRRGIIAILNRDLGEETECVEASNGIEAIDLVQSQNFDLIISDISMPGCNGLEFIQALKDSGKDIMVIILSGYENFEYAKQAVRLGVREYVMKPIKKQEFLELIRSCMADIRKNQENSINAAREIARNSQIVSQVKRESLIQLLSETRPGVIEKSLERLESFGVSFKASLFVCAMVEYCVTDHNRDYIDFVAQNMVDEFFGQESGSTVTVECGEGRLAVIMVFQDQETFWKDRIGRLREVPGLIRKFCKVDAVAGVGDMAYDVFNLNKSLRHASLAADFKIYGGGGTVFLYSELPRGKELEAVSMEGDLKNLDEEHSVLVLNSLEPLFVNPGSRRALEAIRKSYVDFCRELEEKLARHVQGRESPRLRFADFSSFWSFTQLKQEMMRQMRQAQEILAGGEDHLNSGLVSEVLAFVEEHITEELDLNMVAEKFSRTPGYISTIFKKAADSGFNAYITGERIKIARKLLTDQSIPIQKVGEMCGYPNPKYFSVVFRKATGESPRRYREKIEKDRKR